jgi:hypothetical protein
MGFDFSASLSGGSSQTVSSGQTARYTLTLATMGGSSGSFTFQCDSPPVHAACTFNPASESVAANATGSAIVQISTGQALTSEKVLPRPFDPQGRVFPIAIGLFLLPLAGKKHRKALLTLAILALMAAGAISCSGGGGGTGGGTSRPPQDGSNTPPGTYSVGVTATANGVSHKVTLTLTVD